MQGGDRRDLVHARPNFEPATTPLTTGMETAPSPLAAERGRASFDVLARPRLLLRVTACCSTATRARTAAARQHAAPFVTVLARLLQAMTHLLDGGARQTARRRFILDTQEELPHPADKYSWSRREALERHVADFVRIHVDYVGSWKPTRMDLVWMSEHAMNSGTSQPQQTRRRRRRRATPLLPMRAQRASDDESTGIWIAPKLLFFWEIIAVMIRNTGLRSQ